MIEQSALKRAVEHGIRYLFSMRWLVRHGLLSNVYRLWWLVLLSVVSIGAQAATVLSIYVYVRLLEKKIAVPYGLIHEDWVHSQYGLISFILVFCISLGLNYLAVYLIRTQAIKLMREVETRFGRLAFKYAAQLPNLFCKETSKKAIDQELINLMSRDARYCGMTIRLMVLIIPAVVTLGGISFVLLYLDWVISSFVIAASFIIFLLQYPANLTGARATRRWHAFRPLALKAMFGAVRELRLGNIKNTHEQNGGTSDIYHDPSVIGSIDTYAGRIKAIEIGAITTQVGTTLIIALIILVIGNRALSGAVDWAFLISYFTLLRLAAGNFTSLARYTTGMARLYPQVLDFVNFISDVDRMNRQIGESNSSGQYEVCLYDKKRRPGKISRLFIGPGELTALVTLDLEKNAQPEFALALSGEFCSSVTNSVEPPTSKVAEQTAFFVPVESLSGSVVRVARGRLISSLAITDLLGLISSSGVSSWSKAIDLLESSQPWLSDDDIGQLRGLDLNQSVSFSDVDPRIEILAQLNAALARQVSIMIIERDALGILDVQGGSHPLLRLLQSRCLVFVWYMKSCLQSNRSTVHYGEQNLVLCQKNEICEFLFIGDQRGRDRLHQALSGYDQKDTKKNKIASMDSDNDLELD